LFSEHLAFVVEIALGRNIVEIERIGVGLIRERSTMADNDDETAGTKRLRDLLVVCRGRRRCGHRHAKYGRQTDEGRGKRDCPSGEFEHLLLLKAVRRFTPVLMFGPGTAQTRLQRLVSKDDH
jgi:hypothetical protein